MQQPPVARACHVKQIGRFDVKKRAGCGTRVRRRQQLWQAPANGKRFEKPFHTQDHSPKNFAMHPQLATMQSALLTDTFSCSSTKLSLNFCSGWNGRSAKSAWARSISSSVNIRGLPPLSMKCKRAAGTEHDCEDATAKTA
jgi:hypothetical protein